MATILVHLLNWLRRLLRWYVIALMLGLVVLTFVQVLARYIMAAPFTSTDQLARIVLVGLIGAALLLVLVEGVRAWVYYVKADEVHGKVVTPVDQELAEHQTREQAELEILGVDRSDLDLTSLQLGLDYRRLTFDNRGLCVRRTAKPRAARHAHDNEHVD